MTTPIYRDATHRYMAARWQLLQALWRKMDATRAAATATDGRGN